MGWQQVSNEGITGSHSWWTSTGREGGRWQLSTMETSVQGTVDTDTSPPVPCLPGQQRDFGVGSMLKLSLGVCKTPFFNVFRNKQ